MKLKEKFAPYVYCFLGSGMLTNTRDEDVVEHMALRCTDVCDEFAVGFMDWVQFKMADPKFPSYSNERLLKMYKEENNL